MAKLSERDLVCAEVLVGKGKSVRSIATDLGVDESTLRYRLKRRAERAIDGRANQPESCSAFEPIIMAWIARQDFTGETGRPESMKSLYEVLVAEHGYSGSYKAVQRFVRKRAPVPAVRPVRRVETRPGTQAQVDWGTRKVFIHEAAEEGTQQRITADELAATGALDGMFEQIDAGTPTPTLDTT